LSDKFYVERKDDAKLKREVVRSGTITTIRAPRQTGKSSLLVRGIDHARQEGARVVTLHLQRVEEHLLDCADAFLRYLAEYIIRRLGLDVAEVDRAWAGSLGLQDRLTFLMEDYVLAEAEAPIVLALDEVDRLLGTPFHSDFFGLLRAWYENRTLDERWTGLNIVMVISTETYLLIDSKNQSPFNVGLRLYLEGFTEDQVRDLNRQHGSPVKDNNVPELMDLLSGHPYLTRKALYVMAKEQVTWPVLLRTAAAGHGPFGDHLRRYHWMLGDEPDLKRALAQVIRRERCNDEMSRFRLLRAGLIKESGEACVCRCGLYRTYFADKL
jgi:hypothetical protein